MRVQVIGQTWEQWAAGHDDYSATDYPIPTEILMQLDKPQVVRDWVHQKAGDFQCIRDFSIPGRYVWWFQDSQAIYDSYLRLVHVPRHGE